MSLRDSITADARRAKAAKPTGPAWPTKRLGEGDGLSTKPAPGPTGPSGRDAVDWVREKRRREREDEQGRERGWPERDKKGSANERM